MALGSSSSHVTLITGFLGPPMLASGTSKPNPRPVQGGYEVVNG